MAEHETVSIKKSTYNKMLVALVVVLVAFSFTAGFILGGAGKSTTGTVTAQQQGTQAQQTQQQQQTAPPSKVSFDIPSYVPFKGSASAGVNVIEFGDYQCPFCERFFTQTEPQVTSNYVDTGKVKFYFLDFSFLGPDSLTLGNGAWCANEQNKYYEYHDYIYANQGQENSGWATPDKVKSFVGNISGLDVQKFSSCLDSKKYDSRVQALTSLGQNAGVRGTPSFLIGNPQNGYTLFVGACPYSSFQSALDAELAGKSWSVGVNCAIVVNS